MTRVLQNGRNFWFKQTNWSLIVVILIGLSVLVWMPVKWDTSFVNQPTSISRARVYNEHAFERIKVESKQASNRDGDDAIISVKLERKLELLKNQLHSKEYNAANKGILDLLSVHPANRYVANFVTTAAGVSEAGVNEIQLYRYLVTHKINATPLVSPRSDAVNLVASALGTMGHDGWYTWDASVTFGFILVTIAFTFSLVYTGDYRRKTLNLTKIIPESQFKQLLKRGLLPLSLMNVAVVNAVTLWIGLIAILPDHDLGDLQYPIVTVVNGATVLTPLWQYFVWTLIMVNLWALVIAGVSILISSVMQNVVGNAFVLLVIIFTRQLGILVLVPAEFRRWLPFKYNKFPDTVLRTDEFRSGLLVFAAWIGLIWSGVALQQWIRKRGVLGSGHIFLGWGRIFNDRRS